MTSSHNIKQNFDEELSMHTTSILNQPNINRKIHGTPDPTYQTYNIIFMWQAKLT